jgi:hypothetical protein
MRQVGAYFSQIPKPHDKCTKCKCHPTARLHRRNVDIFIGRSVRVNNGSIGATVFHIQLGLGVEYMLHKLLMLSLGVESNYQGMRGNDCWA